MVISFASPQSQEDLAKLRLQIFLSHWLLYMLVSWPLLRSPCCFNSITVLGTFAIPMYIVLPIIFQWVEKSTKHNAVPQAILDRLARMIGFVATAMRSFPFYVPFAFWTFYITQQPSMSAYLLISHVLVHIMNATYAIVQICYLDDHEIPWHHLPFCVVLLVSYLLITFQKCTSISYQHLIHQSLLFVVVFICLRKQISTKKGCAKFPSANTEMSPRDTPEFMEISHGRSTNDIEMWMEEDVEVLLLITEDFSISFDIWKG